MSKQSAVSAKGDNTLHARINECLEREPYKKSAFMTLATVQRKVVRPAALSEVDDYEIRMGKIRSYLDEYREQGLKDALTYYGVAALFVIPLDVFMAADASDLYSVCLYMPRIVKHYLKPFQAKDESPHAPFPGDVLGDDAAAGIPPVPKAKGQQAQAGSSVSKGKGKGKAPARPAPLPRATRGASASQTASKPKGGGVVPGPSIPKSKRQTWFEPSSSSSASKAGPSDPPTDQARSSRRPGLRSIAPKDYKGTQGSGEYDEKDGDYAQKCAGRSVAQKKVATDRDGNVCILTRSCIVEVCHILPFAWTKTENKTAVTNVYLGISLALEPYLGRQQHLELVKLASQVGGLNWAWNMITLKSSLHSCWGRAYMGLKYEGQTPNTSLPNHIDVEMAFYRLGRNKVKPSAVVDLDPSSPRWIDGLEGIDAFGCIRDFDCVSMDQLRDGLRVTVTLPEDDVNKFVAMINLQWACVRVARLCGGGEAPDDLPSFRDMDDFIFPVGIQDEAVPTTLPTRPTQKTAPTKKKTTTAKPSQGDPSQGPQPKLGHSSGSGGRGETTPRGNTVRAPGGSMRRRPLWSGRGEPSQRGDDDKILVKTGSHPGTPLLPPSAPPALDPAPFADVTNKPPPRSPRPSPSPESKGKGKGRLELNVEATETPTPSATPPGTDIKSKTMLKTESATKTAAAAEDTFSSLPLRFKTAADDYDQKEN
ncbi:hypothetical protein N3K66_008184 [Trichothecium roseum]|uniref:Uncharacterized protein n=1 Tax=Trichothecium roseum TaxID=47278 RepID=A0ACC0UUI3_9HYPO|nr:hypothetical protein N3K66_008184 [Trichothecium roseum]